MSEYLSWTCPKCGGHEISCTQANAVVSQKIRFHQSGNPDWYGEINLDGCDEDLETLEYTCANPRCAYRIPVEVEGGWDHESLYSYLRKLEENREH